MPISLRHPDAALDLARPLLEQALRRPRLAWGAVGQHMTGTVVNVSPDCSSRKAADLLRAHDLLVLPVCRDGQLVGLLHGCDLLDEDDEPLGPLMRPPSGYLLDSDPLRDAIMRLLDLNIGGLPVIDQDGQLLGVLTVSDALRAVLGERRGHAHR